MKRRVVGPLAALAVVLGVLLALFITEPQLVQRVGWGCGPDRIPDRVGFFQRSTMTATALAQLPPRTGWPQGRPAVVIDWPGLGFCPAYFPDQTDDPILIWLRVRDDYFVAYYRGGGP